MREEGRKRRCSTGRMPGPQWMMSALTGCAAVLVAGVLVIAGVPSDTRPF